MPLALSELLIAQLENGTQVDNLDLALVPETREDAYIVQSEVVAAHGPIGAWKVQPYPEDSEPLASPIPAKFVFAAAEGIDLNSPAQLAIEAEVSVTLNRDLPTIEGGYTADTIADAISTAQLAIEILAPRFAQTDLPRLAGIADFQNCGGVIYGQSLPFAEIPDLGTLAMDLTVDGTSIGSVTEGPTTERTLRSLAWLANHAAARGTPLQAGMIIITGARIGALPLNGKAMTITAPGFAPISATLA